MKISKICQKCGALKALCICLPLAVPAIEAMNSPPETHCSAPSCTERPLATEPWSPDAPEPDYRTTINQLVIELPAVGPTGRQVPLTSAVAYGRVSSFAPAAPTSAVASGRVGSSEAIITLV